MINSSFTFKRKSIYLTLPAFILGAFLSCSGDHAQNRKNKSVLPEVKEMKAGRPKVFLAYIDSVAKLPDTKFNEAGIRSLNKKFLHTLPLVIYDSLKEEKAQDIVMQYYRNKETNPTIHSEMIFLVPESMTDSLTVGDFMGYFGSIRKEIPLIGVTAQPLPVYIDVSPGRSIQLTFNNNEKQDKAGVIEVVVQYHK